MLGSWLLLAAMVTLAGPDAVLLKNGERLEGVVLEASPGAGVRLRLPDGTVRWLHPMAVERVERAGEPPPTPAVSPPAPPATAPPEPGPERAPAELEPPAAAPPTPPQPGPAHVEPPAPDPARPELPRRPRFAPSPVSPTHDGSSPAPPDPLGYYPAQVDIPRNDLWLSFAIGSSSPFGDSGQRSSSLEALTGGDHVLLSAETGLRLDGRNSLGAVLDVSVGGVGAGLGPICDAYGTECSTATAQLGLFLRHDLAPLSRLNPWGSIGIGYEWLAGDVFAPYEGVESIEVLHASGLQFARLGAGIDWRMGAIGLGLYATVALGRYGDVTVDGADVSGGTALHGWAQAGLRAILWP